MGRNELCLDVDGGLISRDGVEQLIVDYVVVQCGIRAMAPQSITTVYLPGIAANFELERALCCFLYRAAISSREVKIIVAGFTRIYNKKFPKAGRLKSPYDSSLAAKSKASMTRRALLQLSEQMLLYFVSVPSCAKWSVSFSY